MKHPAIRELFAYWDQRRGGRAAPERSDIEPCAIRGVLADTFILAFDPAKGHPFRVAGTRVCALFGREIKGQPFLDLFWREARDEMRHLTAIVAHDSVGVVASAGELSAKGHGPALELLLLPLSSQGRADARLLGALVATQSMDWPGLRAMCDLIPGSYRFLGGRTALSTASRGREARMRHGLVVYDGGQA